MKKKLSLSFILPVSIILFVFLVLKVWPFGDKTILVIDSNTQYVSFINYLKTCFFGTNDFKYTFSATLGQNFIPLLGYYLMSPFNLITIFFKPENIKMVLTIIILIKIGLCGVTMEYYLQKKYPDKKTLLFSLSYALMSYNIFYMYHLMWLDAIILFPLIILGIDYIFEDKKPTLYIFTLALSIIFNYYIGVIVCLGSLIYFIYKLILENKNKEIIKFKVFIKYSISSLLGGFLSMFILLPSFFGLSSSKAVFSLSNLKFDILIPYFNVIAKMFTAATGNGETWHGGPMIACGMVIFILLIMFFLNKKIPKRNKIINAILLFCLATTFVVKPLDLLFHGLNTPNCFDFRHAFIFVFFEIIIACNSYMKLNYNKDDLKKVSIIICLISIIIYLYKFKFNVSTYGLTILLSFIIMIIIIHFLKKNKNISKVLLIIAIADLTINTTSGILTNIMPDKQSNSEFKNYVIKVDNIIKTLKEKDNSLYRMEKTFDREDNINKNMLSINDSMIFDYNGISHFDSVTNKEVEKLMEKLGFRRLLTRAYYNKNGSTITSDMLLSIKYILSKNEHKNYTKIIQEEDLAIYQNPYYLSFGYKIKNDNINIESNNPFLNQNNIIKAFTGINEDIYEYSPYTISYENVKKTNDTYQTNSIGILKYKIKITSPDELYFYISPPSEIQTTYKKAKMYINDVYYEDYFTKYNWGVISLGKHQIGTTIELKFEFEEQLEIKDAYFYYENIDILEKHYQELSKNQIDFKKITSSKLEGKINLDKSSKIFLNIPYDEGWNLLVDGEKIKLNPILNTLTSFELPSGNHTLTLTYTPKYSILGIIISLITLLFSILYIILCDKIWNIYTKYKEIFNYLIIGVLTTLVSLVSYFILSRILDISNNIYFIIANTISWILSVTFAYFTNKKFVFESKTKGKTALKEAFKFVTSRLATFIIDLVIMFILVKLIKINNDYAKIIVQIIVLVLNYIFSKLLVFTNKERNKIAKKD